MAGGKKILVDTNVWLRYVLKDDAGQFSVAAKLVAAIEAGKYLPYVPANVFLEIYFLLSRYYQKTPSEINKFFDYLLQLRNLTIIDKTNFVQALSWHRTYKIKLPDCLVASSLPQNCRLVTWDKDFTKIKDIKTITPNKLI